MRKVLNFVKAALGLAALAAFVLVLVGLFGPLSQRVPVGQQAYPIGTVTPTAPPLPVTTTSQPYPPPQTPTVPSPLTPTFTPTPLVTVTPGPITSKLEIIWAESTRITTEVGPNQPGIITFWRANIADLAGRMSLATMPQGYSLKNASLSPDESKIAFTTLPPPPNSRWWLLGTLWVVNVDGSGLRELAQGIDPGGWLGPYPIWSPDSSRLAHLKLVDKGLLPSETPTVPPPPYKYEIYSVAVDGTDTRLLMSDDTADGIYLLGWSQDGRLLFYERRGPGTGYELWAVDASDEMPPQRIMLLPEYYAFSPDSMKLLFFTTEEGLVMLSVDGKDRRVLLPPEQAFGGIWSADSAEFIGRQGYELQLRAVNVNTGMIRTLLTAHLKDAIDTLLSISPDKQWIAVRGYTHKELYLLQIGSTLRIDIPAPSTGTSYFVGWISEAVTLPHREP